MRIAYLTTGIDQIAGGARVIFEQVNRLFDRGHKIEVWCTGDTQNSYFPCKAPIYPLKDIRLLNHDVLVIADPGFLPQVFSSDTTHSAQKICFLVQHDNELISQIEGAPTYANLLNDFKSYFLDSRHKIIVVSAWLQSVIKEKYQLPSLLARNGVNKELFYPATPLIHLDGSVVLFFYDPQVWKGVADAVHAVNIVRQHIPDLKIIMIGRYLPSTPVVQGKSWSFPFPVIYFNRPDQNELVKIYALADVFVSSSWYEGFGLPGLEAMACGVPVVTTDSGGVREYAIPEETAIVVPPKNPEALAEGILRVLSDEKLRQKLIKNGLEKAKEFDWGKSIDILEKVFSE